MTDDPDGSPVLVMELLDGSTLANRIMGKGLMEAFEAVAIGTQLADALDYLASEGVARIDLKPSNIMIQPVRGPVIIDLGVARDLEATNLPAIGASSVHPCIWHQKLLSGGRPDPRVDIYSLGLVLYYCLVGHNPWEHLGEVARVMWAILNQEIDLSGLSVSQELKQIIARATDRKPDNRFQTAADMGQHSFSHRNGARRWIRRLRGTTSSQISQPIPIAPCSRAARARRLASRG